MKRTVTRVQFMVPLKPKFLHVAAYARVSVEKDAMLHSLSAQVSYYSSMIQSHPGWLFAGVYSDEAITGTKADRAGFQSLLKECHAGNIDMIITKSISRFSRNTVDLLTTVRTLKEIGVDVFFEEQNIHTMSSEGELMLTILASYAQEESLSSSLNMKWRIKKSFEEGKPCCYKLLGYRYSNGVYVECPEEAEIVRRIFELYLAGLGKLAIIKQLNAEGHRTRQGNCFQESSLRDILRNYSYTGNLLLQKTFREDHITKKSRINTGELPMYHAEGTHEPIIPPDDFDRVQAEIERRKSLCVGRAPGSKSPLTSKIVCDTCGKHYRRKTTPTGHIWICATYNTLGRDACPSKAVPENKLFELLDGISMDSIDHLTVKNGNIIFIHLKDGAELEKHWTDRSRAESWTESMRKKAAENAARGNRERRRKNG